MSVRSIAPFLASLSAEKAVTAIGVCSSVSERRRAVTTISPLSAAAGWSLGAAAGASCAKPGAADKATKAAPAHSRARVEFGRDMVGTPLLRRQIVPGLLPGLC